MARVLPDEFSLGYRGRLRILNVLSSGKELTEALREEIYPVSGKHLAEISEAAVLAEAADIPLQQFIKNHTLLPFHRMAAWEGDYVIAHGDPSVPSLINYFGSRVVSSSLARFCPVCAEEEIEAKGFTYWRRTYQLPGFFKCFKHGTQLANGKAGSNCFDSMPSSRLSFEFEFSEQEVLELSANATVQRYIDLGKSILGSDRPVDVHYASSRLYQRAKMLHKRDRQRNFLEFASARIPEFWLKTLSFMTINNLARSSMDSENCFNFGIATECYMVALAALFESTEEALEYWSPRHT